MVKAFANPACAAPFHYWRGGKLFCCALKTPSEPCLDVPDQICQPKSVRSSVFFWLYERCCSRMTLSLDPHRGPRVVPIRSTEPHRKVIRTTEAVELRA